MVSHILTALLTGFFFGIAHGIITAICEYASKRKRAAKRRSR